MRSKGCVIWLLLLFIAMGIFFVITSIEAWHDYQLLSSSGATLQATVTDRSYTTDKRGMRTYTVNYHYVVNDHSYDASDTVIQDDYDNALPGTQISIRYAQTDPTVSHIGTGDSPIQAVFVTILALVLNGFWIFLLFRWNRVRAINGA